ncbi:MAG: nuclear transport factor 2 family protein [Cyclobacteriaceae bacterium]|nr:nuclear transport factor 2 family protein [Cyclobacteriaceae bacterium]
MKVFISACFVLIGFVSFGQKNETIVDQLHRKKFTWLIQKKLDSLNWLMHDQAHYIHSNGWVQTKKEVVDDLVSDKLNYTSIEVVESSVTVHQNTAVVSGKGYFRGLMPDKSEFNLSLFYTEVYVRVGKEWKLLNRLATKISL